MKERDGFWPVLAVLILMAALALYIAMQGQAKAHDAPTGWSYEGVCCNGDNHSGDCQQIPDSAVKIVDGRYVITLAKGDHRLVTVPHVWTRAANESRPSGDEHFHACLWPDEATLRCFYAPPLGF